MKHSLEVYDNGKLIFYSNGKWLYPLFALEDFLRQQNHNSNNLIVKDRIVGRAAALFQLHLGVKTVHAEMLSRLAKEIFDHYHINYVYDKLVDRIQCRTERLLEHEFDITRAYRLIKKLADNNQ